jgi:hypothetical protein
MKHHQILNPLSRRKIRRRIRVRRRRRSNYIYYIISIGTSLDLYLLRHGDVGKGVFSGGTNDLALTESAKKEIATVARSIKALNLQISAIFTSPLKRTIQTAGIIAKILDRKDRISVCDI